METGAAKGARHEKKDKRKERDTGSVGVYTPTGLLFISAYIQQPSNTYFDNTLTKKIKVMCAPRPAAHSGFGCKAGGVTGRQHF